MALTPEILVPQLGDYLIQKGYITNGDLQDALAIQRRDREAGKEPPLLGKILQGRGIIDRATLDTAITEQILELRGALLDAHEKLQLRVEERTAELASALEQLDHLNKLQTRFIAHISHELRTPLYHLMGYLELIAAEDMGPVNKDQKDALGVMQRASERLGSLIEDLILFTATSDHPLSLRFESVSVQDICNAALSNLQDASDKGHVILSFERPSTICPVHGNAEKISWVIRHLLENAVKFTQAGGTVSLKAEEHEEQIIFSVTDTGIGISREYHEEIFEPFRQLDDAVSRQYGGVGLGLALARKIVQAHGSDIQVISEPDKGSTFSFRLEAAH